MKNEFQEIRKEFKKIDTRLEKMESKIYSNLKWIIGLMIAISTILTSIIVAYLKNT